MAAAAAVKLDVLELGKDAAPAGDDALDADEAVEVRLAEVAERRGRRQVGDADVNLVADLLVVGVVEENGVERARVKDRQERLRRVGEKVGKDRLRGREMEVRDLKRLRVDWRKRGKTSVQCECEAATTATAATDNRVARQDARSPSVLMAWP